MGRGRGTGRGRGAPRGRSGDSAATARPGDLPVESLVVTKATKKKEQYDKQKGNIIKVLLSHYKVELLNGPAKGEVKCYMQDCVTLQQSPFARASGGGARASGGGGPASGGVVPTSGGVSGGAAGKGEKDDDEDLDSAFD